MSADLAKKPNQEIDGFDFNDATEGEDERVSSGLIIGEKIKFTEKQIWVDRNGNKLPLGLELVVMRALRVVQKWGADSKPIEEHTQILEEHERWPNIEELNAECPQSEWRKDPGGKLVGPWAGQRLLYLWDLRTAAKYTWPSPKDTKGSRIAINDIRERITLMRQIRNDDNIYAVVTLSDTHMPTSFGGRQRPALPVKYWIRFGPKGVEPVAERPLLGVQAVEPLTAKEAVNDEVRF
jgi:hypothetical protein